MDIQFTEEQELLRSSVQRLLRDQYDFDARRKILASEEGFCRGQWDAFAELGLQDVAGRSVHQVYLRAHFDVEAGGFGRVDLGKDDDVSTINDA